MIDSNRQYHKTWYALKIRPTGDRVTASQQTQRITMTHADNEVNKPDTSKFSESNTIILGIILIYIIFTAVWFIQSRYCSSARRGTATILRRQLGLWSKGSLFFRNDTRNILHYNDDNLPSHYDLDERDYKSWSVLEVASWTRSRLLVVAQSNNGNHHYTSSYYYFRYDASTQHDHHVSNQEDAIILLQQAIDALIQQRIDGASLDYITLEYLSRWMPFGTAVHVMSHYNYLRLPTHILHEVNINTENTNSLSRTKDDVLTSWYSDNQFHQAARNNNHHDVDADEQEQMSSEHVQRLMNERFGLPLPSLRTKEMKLPTNRTAIVTDNETTHHKNDDSPNNNYNLDHILSAMPPHVRAVAERRPELVAKLLYTRQQQQPLMISIHEANSVDDDDEEEEAADLDSESASLLHRRVK